MTNPPDPSLYVPVLRSALEEDIGDGDKTTNSLVPENMRGHAVLLIKDDGIVAGGFLVPHLFEAIGTHADIRMFVPDGERVSPGTLLGAIMAPLGAILTLERTLLNFMQHLSGIATLTSQYVEAVKGTRADILDTRKTTPGLRVLEKYAVRAGGGRNHRMGLFDIVLIKDNHLAALEKRYHISRSQAVTKAIALASDRYPDSSIEVEVEDLECLQAALDARVEIIMLDNQAPHELKKMVLLVDERCPVGHPDRPILEASGGISLLNVREVAETGVDWISVGALTHSAPAVDISLEVESCE